MDVFGGRKHRATLFPFWRDPRCDPVPRAFCCTSSAFKMPGPCSALAHARSTASSCGSNRRSNANDRWNASNSTFGSRSKRPPHKRSSLRSVISVISIAINKSRTAQFPPSALAFGLTVTGSANKIDKSFGVFGVIAAHGEAGQVGAIQRERRNLRFVTLSVPFQSFSPTAPVTHCCATLKNPSSDSRNGENHTP